MSWIMVDVETDGPCPGLFSMLEIGAIVVREPLSEAPTFKANLAPISDGYMEEALKVCGHTRQGTLGFSDPQETMELFYNFIKENGGRRPMFISDNNGFDWQFINYYFWKFCGQNPFGHSSTNLGSLFKGIRRDFFQSFKYLRDTAHTHDPLDDARGNAEAFVKMKHKFDLRVKLK